MKRHLLKAINHIPRGLRKRLFVGFGLATRAMTLGVRIAVADDAGRILLVRHTYVEGWYLPGGGVERSESSIEAIAKELREEAAMELLERPSLFHLYKNTSTSRFDHVALFIGSARPTSHPFVPNGEIAEIGFFDRNDLPQATTKQTRDRLAEIFDNQPVRDIW